MDKNCRFYYFGRNNAHYHYGIITFVTFMDVDSKNNKVLKTGISFCSQKDRFNKKIGKEIALKNIKYEIPFTGNSVIDLVNFYNFQMTNSDKPFKFRNKFLGYEDVKITYFEYESKYKQ